MSTELDEIKRMVAESSNPEKYADTIRQMELMEQQTAELEKANAERRASMESADTLKSIQKDIAEIKAQTADKPLTKEDIMSIKDDHKRLQAIRENMHLFQREEPEQTAVQKAQAYQNERIMAKYGVTADMSPNEICDRMPAGLARTYAIKKSIERN